jgi:hypothetical protein
MARSAPSHERAGARALSVTDFFFRFALKVAIAALLAFIGGGEVLMNASRWLFIYAMVAATFAILFQQRPGGPALNYWDEALLFLLLTHGLRILAPLADAPAS